MNSFLQDLRYGARMLRKNRGFTFVAVVTLALGVGANTALFQLIEAVRLRTLPVKKPQELAEVGFDHQGWYAGHLDGRYPVLTNPLWEQLRDRQEAFSGIFAWGTDTFNLAVGGEVRNAQGLWVSGDFFNVLGVTPALGRVFTTDDDRHGCSASAVISYSFWKREFGGNIDAVGRKLSLAGHAVEIIGVTPLSFYGIEVGRGFDVAVPLCAEPLIKGEGTNLERRNSWWLAAMGRLKPGWSLGLATAHLNAISPALFEATLPTQYEGDLAKHYLEFRLKASPAGAGFSTLREEYEEPLWLLLGLAGIVLLIACANLANLMLARASARQHEIAVRLALGASRGRLVRQLLAESMLLASLGATLGVFLANDLSRLLVSFLDTQGNPVFVHLEADWRMIGFTAGLAMLTCVLFGLAPALKATRISPNVVLHAASRGLTASRERFGLRRILVVSQVALSLVLLMGALLFSRTLSKLSRLDAGFRQDGILITNVDLARLNLPKERRQPFKQQLVERIRAIPGVESAAETNMGPWGDFSNNSVMGDADGEGGQTNLNQVSSGYFNTLQIPLIAGRDFNQRDTLSSPRVAVVNEEFARRFLNGANPIGKTFRMGVWAGQTPTVYEVVGLVKNTKYQDLREAFTPIVFFSAAQDENPDQVDHLFIRSNRSLSELMSSVKGAVDEVSPDIEIEFQTFKTQLRDSLLRERLMATISGFFGLLALLLVCIGIYGIVSYGVANRIKEIGIRTALGAQGRDVLRLILREALLLVIAGVAVGLPAALAVTRLISSLLFGLTLTDPLSIGLAALVLMTVTIVASYIPARRATKVDPLIALRYE